MSDHASHSPSSAHRWVLCPGSIREGAGIKDEPNEAGIDGTHTHTLLEHVLNNYPKSITEFYKLIGLKLNDDYGQFEVDIKRLDRVWVVIEYLNTKYGDLIKNAYGTDIVIKPESRVNPEYLVSNPDMHGTCDIQIIVQDTLEIIDYKDGFVYVDVKNCEQLELYTLGVLAEYKLPVNVEYPFSKITTTIIQPKNRIFGRDMINSVDYTVQDILGKSTNFVVAYADSKSDNPTLEAGAKQCRWCPVRGNCRTRTEFILKRLKLC